MYLIYWRGKVGNSLASFCNKKNIAYTICDDTDAPSDFSDFKNIIPSPGIPSTHRIYESGKILSELDFLSKYIPKWFQIHAITGTDGKSTTSWISFHILQWWDLPVYLGGNFGTPLASILEEIKSSWESRGHIVLEVSSFMAHGLTTFSPNNTILTNLHPDHLDWHTSIDAYYWAKFLILQNTKERILYPEIATQLLPGLKKLKKTAYILPNEITVIDKNLLEIEKGKMIDISESQFYWQHNLRNIWMASRLALDLDHNLNTKKISEILAQLSPLQHRLEKVSHEGNRLWIDDSKSTTGQSLRAALTAFWERVILIAWGKDKGDTFDDLKRLMQDHCKACIALGETKHQFLETAHEVYIPGIPVANMQEAVMQAYNLSQENDIILLSPGCSSQDMFRDYYDRGKQYQDAIKDYFENIKHIKNHNQV